MSLRTTVLSSVLTGAPIAYLLQGHFTPYQEIATIALAILIPTTLMLLMRHTRKRARRSALDMLIEGRPTLDRIIAELEARAAQRDTPTAR